MNLAKNLKKIRKENNLSQEQLAEKLGISRQSVSKWESGQAYPEMDKVLQLCRMFNINIDDLMNQDIGEINATKQEKANSNKFIDDFLGYVSKTVDMFSDMKFKAKLKCVFEQIIIATVLLIIFVVIGLIGGNIVSGLFSFISGEAYWILFGVIKSLYYIGCLTLGIVLLLHIFKTRYLDYYEPIKNEESEILSEEKETTTENSDIAVEIKGKQKFFQNEQKVIIRDPKHSGYRFISGLLKCFLFLVKSVSVCIAIFFCCSFVFLIACEVLSFLFITSGLLFAGGFLIISALIVVNFIILNLLYNFIISRKTKRNKFALIFLISLVVLGVGTAFVVLDFPEYTDDFSTIPSFVKTEETVKMSNDLVIDDNYYTDFNYVEEDRKDIKLIYNCSEFYDIELEELENNNYSLYFSVDGDAELQIIKSYIEDINRGKITDYSNFDVTVYASKENIEKLKENLRLHREKISEEEYQNIINEYENQINEYEEEIERLNDRIFELEEYIPEVTVYSENY